MLERLVGKSRVQDRIIKVITSKSTSLTADDRKIISNFTNNEKKTLLKLIGLKIIELIRKGKQ